jgi:hypothetical protein
LSYIRKDAPVWGVFSSEKREKRKEKKALKPLTKTNHL